MRSATFALGVLQGLANVRVLDRFDYLSTVSGGGYIGGWLTAWLHREGKTSVLAGLDPEQASTATSSTPSPVERVRETCRFLAPQGGLLSADVWTLLVTMERNLILNWFVLLPLIAAALLVPHLYYAIVKALEVTSPPPPGTPYLDRHHPAIWLLAITVRKFLTKRLDAADAPPPLLHPNLAGLYREKVTTLAAAREQPGTRPEAAEAIRGLVDAIVLNPAENELRIELKGNLAAMLSAAQNAKRSPEGDLSLQIAIGCGGGI